MTTTDLPQDTKTADAPRAPEEEPWATAVRAKLRELCEKPLTPGSARRVSDFAKLAAELAGVVKGAPPMGQKRGGGIYSVGSAGMPVYNYDDELMPITPINVGGAQSWTGMSSNAETYGATVLRELIAVAAKIGRPRSRPADLVRAIVEAKKGGLDDLAAKLEAELMDTAESEKMPAEIKAGAAETDAAAALPESAGLALEPVDGEGPVAAFAPDGSVVIADPDRPEGGAVILSPDVAAAVALTPDAMF